MLVSKLSYICLTSKNILNLVNDKDKRKRLGENAFNFAHETFDIRNIAQQYEDIYEELF